MAGARLQILHVYKDYFPIIGGIENHIRSLAGAQAVAGHQVTVLVTNPGGEIPNEIVNGVNVMRVRRQLTVASNPFSLRFPVALRQQTPDITHLHFPYPWGEVSQLLFAQNRPFVMTYHSDIVRQRLLLALYQPLLSLLLRRAKLIMPTSQNYVDSSRFLQRVAGKCRVVPLSVNPSMFVGKSPLLPRKPGCRLLFVGRHRYYKGVDTLIRAMPDIPAELLVCGDGPERGNWQALARQLGLERNVRFLGEVSDADLPRLYASADLFVLPANARAEAFGMVLLEAMASGLPCITTDVGSGTSYVVQHGITGLVVPPEKPEALTAAIRTLIEDESLRLKMGAAARQRVSEEFTIAHMVNSVDEVYREALSGS